MRPLSLGPPRRTATIEDRLEWIEDSLMAIERASTEEDLAVADDYAVTGPASVSRTIDATSPTLAQTSNVLAQLLTDMKERGPFRYEA